MAVLTPDEWLQQQQGAQGVTDSAGASLSAPTVPKAKPPVAGASVSSSIQSPDEWLAEQIKAGHVLPPGHPQNTSAKDGSNVQLLDNTRSASPAIPAPFMSQPNAFDAGPTIVTPGSAPINGLAKQAPFIAQGLGLLKDSDSEARSKGFESRGQELGAFFREFSKEFNKSPDVEALHSQLTDSTTQAIAKGVGRAVEQQITPANAAMLVGGGAIEKTLSPVIKPIVNRIVAAAVASAMTKQAATAAGTASALPSGPERTGAMAEAGTTGVLGAVAGYQGAKPGIKAEQLGGLLNEAISKGVKGTTQGSMYSTLELSYPKFERDYGKGPSVAPDELTDKALAQNTRGHIWQPGETPALGQMWRERVSRAQGLVKLASEVRATAQPEEIGGKVSFQSEAGAGSVPSSRQLEAKKVEPVSEQQAKMEGSFVPSGEQEKLGVGVKGVRSPENMTPDRQATIDSLRPAVRLSDGTIIPGQRGDIHNDIITREARNGNAKPLMEDLGQKLTRGFVKVGDNSKLITRDEGQKLVGSDEPLHSEWLNEHQSRGKEQRLPRTNPQVNTPEFKKWFGKSKVVDSEGKPLVVYHGTGAPDFVKFNTKGYKARGYQFGEGAYFTPEPNRASEYSGIKSWDIEKGLNNPDYRDYLGSKPSRVYPTFVKLENPYVINSDASISDLGYNLSKENKVEYARLQKKIAERNKYSSPQTVGTTEVGNELLREQGYDGIIKEWKKNDPLEIVAFHPEQIKSAIGNRGTFDSNDPSILRSPSPSTDNPHNVSFEHVVLGLDKPSQPTIDIAKNIASNPDLYGREEAGLLQHLINNFGRALTQSTTILHEQSGRSGILYDPSSRTIQGMRMSEDPLRDFVHETTHAATYDALEAPKSFEQRRAVDQIDNLRNQIIEALPPKVRAFFDKFQSVLSKTTDEAGMQREEMAALFKKEGIDVGWFRRLYQLSDNHEYLAGVYDDASFRQHLNDHTPKEGEGGFVRQTWDAVKDLLGIKKGSTLDRTFDAINELHDPLDVQRGSDFPPEPPSSGEIGKAQRLPPNAITISQNFFEDNKPNKGWREEAEANLGYLAGHTVPRTMAADKTVGESLIKYASSRISGPAWGKALASRVLGEHWQDEDYANKLGAVLTQDRLQAVKRSLDENGQADDAARVRNVWDMEGSPFSSEADYTKALNEPGIRQSIELHKENVQPLATAQHVATGGKLAKSGPDTDAFVNLIALKGSGGVDEAESINNLLYGSVKGDLANPLKKGSAFSKPAKGTATTYDFNYRNIAERMVSGNYEQAALREMYDTYIKKGLAVEESPGIAPPVIRGKPSIKVPVEIRATPWGKLQRKNLWVERTLAPELEAALATDKPIRGTAATLAIGALNDMQIAGPTDACLHIGNMWAAIAGSQGGENIMVDLARQVPGVRGLHTAARIAYNIKRVMSDTPDVQRELASMAEIGAGRAKPVHAGLLDKVLPTSKLIKLLDSAGRLTLNHMFDNLTKRGLVENSPEQRREFINQMGQYNARLRGKIDTLLRETGVSPFIVAGKNFNRLATQRLLLHPSFEAKDSSAVVKTRLVNAIGLVATVATLPLVINAYTTGRPFGRKDKNIPYGAIDTGKDDSEGTAVILDLLHGNFLRRALRITGEQAVESGVKAQETPSDIMGRAATQILEGYLGPFTGPVPNFVYTAGTGKNLRTGQLVSENPNSLGQNVWAAVTQLNPSFAAAYKGWFESEGTQSSHAVEIARQELGQIRRAVGVSTARPKSLSQQEHESGVDKLPLAERADKEAELKSHRKPMTDDKARLQMEVSFAARQRENIREVENGLSRDNR